jgi:hypothetical protein
MGKRCPPGVFCIENVTIVFICVIALIFGIFIYWRSRSLFASGNASGNSYTNTTITLSNKNYTDIDSLLTDINMLLASRSINLSFELNSSNLVQIVKTRTINRYYFITSNLLNIILGFTSSTALSAVNTTGAILTAIRQPNLNFDNYISLFIKNIPHNSSSSNQLISFKIPLNGSGNIIYFNSENISFSQYITITDQNLVVDKLQIVVYDRFGNQLTNNGFDYSLTVGFSFY